MWRWSTVPPQSPSPPRAVFNNAMSAPGAVQEGIRGRVVIACSEGEWHMLPAQMATEVLRLRGADVSFIGPSVPADDLAEFIGDDPPAAVAVTCSMPMSLVGAWRSISALRELGMTVVCGGRGFGPDGRWGLALGADHWATDFRCRSRHQAPCKGKAATATAPTSRCPGRVRGGARPPTQTQHAAGKG